MRALIFKKKIPNASLCDFSHVMLRKVMEKIWLGNEQRKGLKQEHYTTSIYHLRPVRQRQLDNEQKLYLGLVPHHILSLLRKQSS